MKISNPEMKVVRFANEDVIATSLYYMSAADYNEAMGTNYTTPYVWINGAMSGASYNSSTASYSVNVTSVEPATEEDMLFVRGGYIEEAGIYFPGTASSYEAYIYDGNVYTKGVTYKESIGQ